MSQKLSRGLVLAALAVGVSAHACEDLLPGQTSVILRDGKVIAQTPKGEKELTEIEDRTLLNDDVPVVMSSPAFPRVQDVSFSGQQGVAVGTPVPPQASKAAPAAGTPTTAVFEVQIQSGQNAEELARSITRQVNQLLELLRSKEGSKVESQELQKAISQLQRELLKGDVTRVRVLEGKSLVAPKIAEIPKMDLKGLEGNAFVMPKMELKELKELKGLEGKTFMMPKVDMKEFKFAPGTRAFTMTTPQEKLTPEQRRHMEEAMKEAHRGLAEARKELQRMRPQIEKEMREHMHRSMQGERGLSEEHRREIERAMQEAQREMEQAHREIERAHSEQTRAMARAHEEMARAHARRPQSVEVRQVQPLHGPSITTLLQRISALERRVASQENELRRLKGVKPAAPAKPSTKPAPKVKVKTTRVK